jgi:hypothetical protein
VRPPVRHTGDAGQLAVICLACCQVSDPVLRDHIQLVVMRWAGHAGVPALGKIAARDRYYESPCNCRGDWPEDP